MDLNDFVTGLLVGLAIGLGTGLLWDKAYCLIKEGLAEKKARKNDERGTLNPGAFFDGVSKTGIMVILLALYLMGLGIFQVISYTRLSDFVSCQADYNQRSSLARSARTDATRVENDTLYTWLLQFARLATQPRDPDAEPDPDDVKDFTDTLSAAVEAHNDRVVAEQENPYPPEPDEYCGTPLPSQNAP